MPSEQQWADLLKAFSNLFASLCLCQNSGLILFTLLSEATCAEQVSHILDQSPVFLNGALLAFNYTMYIAFLHHPQEQCAQMDPHMLGLLKTLPHMSKCPRRGPLVANSNDFISLASDSRKAVQRVEQCPPSTPLKGFPGGSDGKESACNTGNPGSIPGLGRYPGEGNGCPLQYSCLENSKDRGAWQVTVHGVTKSQTRLND